MKISELPQELQDELLAALGDDEYSPNWQGELTLEVGRGANTDNCLIGQGSMTWVIDSGLWIQLQIATK